MTGRRTGAPLTPRQSTCSLKSMRSASCSLWFGSRWCKHHGQPLCSTSQSCQEAKPCCSSSVVKIIAAAPAHVSGMARERSCPEAPAVSRVMLFGYRWKKRGRRDLAEAPGDSVPQRVPQAKAPSAGTQTSLLCCFHPAKPHFFPEMSLAARREAELF